MSQSEVRPCLNNRRVVEVNANQSWEHSLRHRVYSCPDTQAFHDVLGAPALTLTEKSGRRVPLGVSTVITLAPDNRTQLDALNGSYRARLHDYERDVAAENSGILEKGVTHRFYFLSDESWPVWLQELTTGASDTEWAAILSICFEPDRFVEWPKVGMLLWSGCTRHGCQQKHRYPADVIERLLKSGIHQPDTRNNGPAIMAFLAAGGTRLMWGNEGWPIHHIYDGTGSLLPKDSTVLHAVRDGGHFTHSGGLVAVHPVVHHLAHQSALLKGLLRREAFLRFGYDPMKVFKT